MSIRSVKEFSPRGERGETTIPKFRRFDVLVSLVVLVFGCSATFAATEIFRSRDFHSTTAGLNNTHEHGGFLAASATRWSYYLITAEQRQDASDTGLLLSKPDSLIPLSGFAVHAANNHFMRHAYRVSENGMSLTWNHNAENPTTELAHASLAVFFHPLAAGTYSIIGDLLWRSTSPTEMRRGAGVEVGVLRATDNVFERLFAATFEAPQNFTEPKPVEGFAGNAALQNLKLAAADRIVFLWHSDRANYRGLEGIDKDVRIAFLEGEPLPSDPAELATLTTYQRLFSLMDLNLPALTAVKAAVDNADYSAAMREYTRCLAERMGKLPRQEKFVYWLYGVASADELLDGKLTTVKYGDTQTHYTFDIGRPGQLDFFKAATADYRTTIRDNSTMQWVTKHAAAYQKTSNPKYLQAWLATWDDFARNWEAQYAEVRNDPAIWGRRPDGRRNLVGIDWLNAQLYLAWRLESMHAGLLACLQTAHDAGQLDQIDPAMLARTLIRAVTAETVRARRYLHIAEHLVPNQIRHLAGVMFAWGMHFPEFHDSQWWRDDSVPIFTLTHNPDGTDREHSLNYFGNNLTEVIELLHQLPPEHQDPQFLAQLEQKSAYRDRVKPALTRPDGILPTVGKNNVWREYGQSKPFEPPSQAFTSILFPYNGFTIQRDGWQPDSLYLFLRGNRPGSGHWRDQDGGLQLSAYGRNLLVSAIGEMYDDRNGTWSGYFYSAIGQNTILVDGMSHKRRSGGFDQLDDTLWHTSETIELMETEMSGPYGGWDFRVDGSAAGAKAKAGEAEKRPDVTDITHRRQVHFLRQAKCWIVTDRVDSEQEHDFTQTWCFGPEFKESEVVADSAQRRIRTVQPGAPNLGLYHFGLPALDYRKYVGVYSDNQILGWSGILADREKWLYTPKVDTHANWRSRGAQVLITLMLPSSNEHAPLKAIHDAGKGRAQGFDAELIDGTRIFYRAAPEATALEADGISAEAQSLLVVRNPAGKRSGMVLGAIRFDADQAAYANFEFEQPKRRGWSFSKPATKTTPITAPDIFRWVQTKQGLQPLYRQP